MNAMAIAGVVVMLAGFVMAGDPKSFGFKTSAIGFAIVGVGFFLGLFGYFGGTESANRGGSGRKIRDHSV